MCKGNIFNIQRFSTSDGPGIRTVIFMKGCPLDCNWCHNPESKSPRIELLYKQELCIGCEECVKSCPNGAHIFSNHIHHFERQKCSVCTRCAAVCPSNALEICGKTVCVQDVLEITLRDKEFYENSGGGITLSGGEPLLQYDFSLGLLKLAKENNIHTAIETCGFSSANMFMLNKYVDLWLYDIKLFPEAEHIKYTGVSNRIILYNLHLLDQIGAQIILRCPIIPDVNFNKMHFEQLATLANSLENLVGINLEPYHPLGLSKGKQLNKKQVYQNERFLLAEEIYCFAEMLRAKTNTEIVII